MKKVEFIKKAIDDNIVDKNKILSNILDENVSIEHTKGIALYGYKRLAFRIASILLVASLALIYSFRNTSLPNTTAEEKSKIADSGQDRNQSAVDMNKNNFILFACAVKGNAGESEEVDKNNRVEINYDGVNEIPYGKISRGKLSSYVDEKGKKIEQYEVVYGSDMGITYEGENIESVTYTSANGELHYFDVELLKKMEKEGKLYICKIPMAELEIDSPWSFDKIKKVFNEKWVSGKLDKYKKEYFEGKDINLDDYQISIGGAHDGTNSEYLKISKREEKGPEYFQNGAVVRVSGETKWPVTWYPKKAADILQIEGTPAKYEELPSDDITIDVAFKNGEKLRKVLKLYFDNEGNLITEFKQ